jgi:hypothetical protein
VDAVGWNAEVEGRCNVASWCSDDVRPWCGEEGMRLSMLLVSMAVRVEGQREAHLLGALSGESGFTCKLRMRRNGRYAAS